MKGLILGAAALAALIATPASATVFTNGGTQITVVDGGETTSDIVVSGLVGTISKITISLYGLSHTYPDDLVLGLLGPTSQGLVFMSGTGGSTDVNNINLTFDDAASGQTPQSFTPAGALNGGTYQVSNYGAYQFTFYPNLSNFAGYNGTNPNGTWTLFVDDVFPADGGKFAGGWSLDITTLSAAVPEPATWAMMILGFGMVGGALRSTRRRPALAAA